MLLVGEGPGDVGEVKEENEDDEGSVEDLPVTRVVHVHRPPSVHLHRKRDRGNMQQCKHNSYDDYLEFRPKLNLSMFFFKFYIFYL